MRIEVILTENEIADQFVQAFAARRLPEKFFYWFPLSVKAWLDLCRDGAYRNFIRSFNLISANAASIAKQLPQEIEVVSLGSGQGNKDLILLEAIRRSGRNVFYVPVDSSQALLEMACRGAMRAGLPYCGFKADVMNRDHLLTVRSRPVPRLYVLLGNTLGGFPVEFCRLLGELFRPVDFLLADGEIQSTDTIAGYDNPVNRRFAFSPLAGVGITESDGRLVFETREDPDRPGLYFLAKYFQAQRNLSLNIAGSTINIVDGEKLEMNFSCKYTPEAFLTLLKEAGGFVSVSEFTSDDSGFLMILARRIW